MAQADLARINTNIGALQALNSLSSINRRMNIHSLRLATGRRINEAADDVAGFTIATKLHVRSQGLGVALNNIGDAKNMMSIAEGNLTKISDILQKMKSKATQAANDSLGTEERTAIKNELESLTAQINDIVGQTKWNSNPLLSGSGLNTGFTFQTGAGVTYSDLSFKLDATTVGLSNITAYTASGMGVQVLDTASVATSYSPSLFAVAGLGTSATIGSGLTRLSSGSYSVEVTDVAAGGGTVTFRVRNSAGSLVSIDSDGDGAGGTGATATTVTFALTSGATATFDTGVGIKFSLSGLASNETGQFGISYTGANRVDSHSDANLYMTAIDNAISDVSKALSYIGANVNRLSYQEETLTVAQVNTDAARSRIQDADMAYEQLQETKLRILQQTATAMLAQANTSPQAILSLFR
ncbi:MAG: hypothetical protein GXO75_01225 [Calditrichaeota bacterium]|nr:hypothetical protein [Calditrichota bacterium]